MHRLTFGAGLSDAGQPKAWEQFQASQDRFVRFMSTNLSSHDVSMPPAYDAKTGVGPDRIPVYDVDDAPASHGAKVGGLIGLIRSGQVGVRRGHLQRFTPSGVVIHPRSKWADGQKVGENKFATAVDSGASSGGTHHEYDSVILATGFRHGLPDFLKDHEVLLGRPGQSPVVSGCASDDSAADGGGQAGAAAAAAAGATAAAAEAAVPLVDAYSRSLVLPSISLVGLDQFKSTLSVGPVHACPLPYTTSR